MTRSIRPDTAVSARFRGPSGGGGDDACPAPPHRRQRSVAAVTMVLAVGALAGLAVAFALNRGPPPAAAGEKPAGQIPFFGYCEFGGGTNCVVDGDTFYFGTDKVRIANIDAPETHPPRCPSEARLGEAATHRLRDLLNGGKVTLTSIDRDEDVDRRKLRLVAAGGADVGEALVEAGLARYSAGGRTDWCG